MKRFYHAGDLYPRTSAVRSLFGISRNAMAHTSQIQHFTLRSRVCDMMKRFYDAGMCSGTGGGIAIRDSVTGDILMAPSGVAKEALVPGDIFVADARGCVKEAPEGHTLTQCAPLFQVAFDFRDAGAVIHSHAAECVVTAERCAQSGESRDEFRITGFEMIKGIAGMRNSDVLVVPIIDNTEDESDLADTLCAAVTAYPHTYAVLVRHHGMYVWGDTVDAAKRHAECYQYLFRLHEELARGQLSAHAPLPVRGVRAWRLPDELKQDRTMSNRALDSERVSEIALVQLGIMYKCFDGDILGKATEHCEVGELVSDVVNVSREALGDRFESVGDSFFGEHYHAHDEIRCVLEGSGYFDVRGKGGEWIRIQVHRGDFITIPAGCIHRFTVDERKFIIAMRIFQKKPEWLAIDVSVKSVARDNYVSRYL